MLTKIIKNKMQKSHSLLNQIKSNYILEKIFSFAFIDIKSTIKLIKYNKNLFKRLNINIKDSFEYETKTEIFKRGETQYSIIIYFKMVLIFIPFFIYLIMFYAKGKFNSENIKEKYNKKKKGFVDFMDNYILLIYIVLIISLFLVNYILNIWKKFTVSGNIKMIIFLTYILLDLLHFIFYIIKFDFTKKIINKKINWFYNFDITLMIFMTIYLMIFLPVLLCFFIDYLNNNYNNFGDIIKIILYKIKGVNILDFHLSSNFDNFSEVEKIKIIFNKHNIESYEYKLNTNQIDLIKKINNIRKKNNSDELKYNNYEKLPNYIMNNPLDIHFYPNKNLYKLPNCYLFKYPKFEFEKHINDESILNIIIDENLYEINIIEQNNFELITIYNKSINSKMKENNNYIKIEIPLLNHFESKEELKN